MRNDQPDFKWLRKGVAKANEGIADRLNSSDSIYEGNNRRGSSGRGSRDRRGDDTEGRSRSER
ncbi:MAG: hypothetical protein GEV07_10880 [Streptosporangiales bacterium]|nr:hypothetical protein [Streptosporangiales bacterium]